MTLELVSHHLCPYVQRAAIALAEKGVPFTRTYIDLDAKPRWFSEISPLGKVPLLRVDGEVIFESAVILEYLEETQAPALHPGDALQRAKHRAWIEFGSSVLSDLWGFETAVDETTLEQKRDAMRLKFERLEQVLGEGPYFDGARFSLVDAVFGPVFRYWDVFDGIRDFGVFSGLPKVSAWRRALAARASVRDAVTPDHAERLRAFLRQREGVLAAMMR